LGNYLYEIKGISEGCGDDQHIKRLQVIGMTTQRIFTEQEILDGLNNINQTLIQQGLPLMTLDEYKESLKYPISDELLPRYPVKK